MNKTLFRAALTITSVLLSIGILSGLTFATSLPSNTITSNVYQSQVSAPAVCINAYYIFQPLGGCIDGAFEIVMTTYTNVGNGKVQGVGSSPLPNINFIPFSYIPLTNSIGQYNLVNTPNLLTCPNAPNSGDPMEYLTTGNYIDGNRCIANSLPLITVIGYKTVSTWNIAKVVSTKISTYLKNPVDAYIGNLGFTNELNNSGNLYISANQNTNSYGYQLPQASNQSAIWDWYAKYANLDSSSQLSLKYQGTANLLRPAAGIGVCIYSYSYQVSTSVTFRNGAIPFPTSISSSDVPSNYQLISLLPEIYYTANIPVLSSSIDPGSEYLSLNYSIYNPVNINTPNSLEPFNLSTGTTLLVNMSKTHSPWLCPGTICNYNTYTLARVPSNVLSFTSPAPLGGFNNTFDIAPSDINTFGNGKSQIAIQTPTFISVSPNNKVYILNYTTHCGFTTACFFSSAKYNTLLFNVSAINSGDYNLSPNTFPTNFGTPSASQYTLLWKSYWSKYLPSFASNFYVTGICDLSAAPSPCYGNSVPTSPGNGPQIMQGIEPTGIATDYQGDVFIVGVKSTSGITDVTCWLENLVTTACQNGFEVGALYSNHRDKFANVNVQITPRDVAVSPNGQYIYVSAPNSGNIVVVNGNTLQQIGDINLAYPSLNIAAYLSQDGGPFNSSQIRSYYAGSPAVQDIASNHHPMAISEYDGLLYVVDNWTFTVKGTQSSILMLRAFSYNGVEVPIDSRDIPDLSSGTLSLNQFTSGAVNYQYPPYGWPLSANFSLQSTGSGTQPYPILKTANNKVDNYQILCNSCISPTAPSSTTTIPSNAPAPTSIPITPQSGSSTPSSISYCAYECTYSPAQMSPSNTFGYLPIGPLIEAIGNPTSKSTLEGFGFTTDYNDTSYLIAHTGSSEYTLLLEIRPDIQNYTKVSFAQNASYMCIISASAPESTCATNPKVSSLYPPLVLVPSAFDFAENQGSPKRFLSLPNSFSAAFPLGINNGIFSNPSNNIKNNGISNTVNYNSVVTAENGAISSNGISNVINTYIESKIVGVFSFPYTAQIKKSTTFQQESATFYGILGFCLPFTVWAQPSSSNNNYYLISKVTADSSTSNIPIEGGLSYLIFNATKNIFQPNMSDVGLIINPYIGTYLLTNRNIGEFFANISVEKAFNLPSPLTINATHFFSYVTQGFTQIDAFGVQPAFVQERESGVGSETSNAACSFCFLPNYYYNAGVSKLFVGNNVLTSQEGINTYNISVFQLYKKLSYYNAENLDLKNNSYILGYDRIIFNYADAFNNIISFPLDVDLANITTISINASPTVNANNPNQTKVTVSGTAGYYSSLLGGYIPVPSGSQIFLYYGQNINYFNSSNTPTSNPSGYFEHAEQCAFSSSQPSAICQLANPLSSVSQGGSYLEEATYPDYSPNLDSTGNCKKLTASLLTPLPNPNCNIYGKFGLPATGYALNGKTEVCGALSSTGNGILTTQVGLIGIVTTNSQGQFSDSFEACGVGSQKILAVFYGFPPPEPISVNEPTLSTSVNFVGTTPNTVSTYQYNYYYAPNSTDTSVYIGSYLLSFGQISVIILVVVGVAVSGIFASRYFMRDKKARIR